MMRRICLLGLVALAPFGCTRQGFLKAPEADPEVSGQVGSFSADTHFLLEPIGEPESLLGRAVQISSSGGWTIADSLAPGCEVAVERSVASYEKTYQVGLDDMTTMAAGYRDLVGLNARFGRSVQAEYAVQNAEILQADTRGPCGDVIVSSVRVGTGERRLLRKAEGKAAGGAGKGEIGVRGGREGTSKVEESMRWSSPQAYAFAFKRLSQEPALDVDVSLPASLREGDALSFEIKASRAAYLVIIFLEESGQGGVLWPGPDLATPKVEAGGSLLLPPAGTDRLVAALREPGKPARESLIVYAFTEAGDFERVKPQDAREAGDGAGYAARLAKELVSLPMSRWSRATASYVIEPATPGK